ncbi:hypothetical protein N7520_000230, partial [Penicillium odoratum]|uniref:uncharacterized protein n=1 Tax=Penicillium odoratum TaxID=1167516 RepID=UPI002546A9D7
LLDTGEDADLIDEFDKTLLHIAAEQGNWDIARLLLERIASPLRSNETKSIPLHLAADNGHLEFARLLIENKELQQPKRTCTATTCSNPRGQSHGSFILNGRGVLTSTADRLNDTALQEAAKKGHHEICELLIEHDRGIKHSMIERMLGITPETHMKNV